jgi:polyisoprenoid-binding protein YceI
MQPYNPVKRTGTEKGLSVYYAPELIQEGLTASKINAAYTFIPCDIKLPKNVHITPLAQTNSANGIALFTTVVGWEIDSLDTLKVVADLDAWAQGVVYNTGTLVYVGTVAYVCLDDHTSTTGGTAAADFATDLAANHWLALDTTTFIKITHTAAGSAKTANFTYKITGQ